MRNLLYHAVHVIERGYIQMSAVHSDYSKVRQLKSLFGLLGIIEDKRVIVIYLIEIFIQF